MEDTLDAIPDIPGDQQTSANTGSLPGQSLDSGIENDISVSVSQHSEESYRMDRRGKLVLICNTKFDASLKLKDRKGTDRDIASIKNLFQEKLGFTVGYHRELTKLDMLRAIVAAAEAEDNKNYDCFAIFILTHGSDSGKIYGTDGDIAISQLTVPLKNDLLVGKPKMVFVQACRGTTYDKGKQLVERDDGGSAAVTIPVEADFLYVFSTADGYVSFQNPNYGSWFVQALCSELGANWHQLEMMQMLTRVCRALAYNHSSYTPSNPATHQLKQISSVTTTLTKAIRFAQP